MTGDSRPAKPKVKPKPKAKAAPAKAKPNTRSRASSRRRSAGPWGRLTEAARATWLAVRSWRPRRPSPVGWRGGPGADRTAWIAGGAILLVLALVIAVDNASLRGGLTEAVSSVRHALGLAPEHENTFEECLKGATEGAVSTALPIEAIVVAGELVLASPILVAAGVGLGCGVGTINALATAGVGWTVHTTTGLWHIMTGH